MRHLLMAIAISGATVGAQTPQPHPSPAPLPVTVAPPIVLPLPPLMTPPAGGLTPGVPLVTSDPLRPSQDLYRAGRQAPRHTRTPLPFGVGYYGVADTEPAAAPALPTASRQPLTGLLRLSVTPADAQVFVDAAYVGTAADLEKQPMAFSEGLHRVEIRAPGFQTVSVDVRIDRGATLTYRNALARVLPVPPPREQAPAASAAPMYLIQNCYLGNVPPRPQRLPAGCDIRHVQILGTRSR